MIEKIKLVLANYMLRRRQKAFNRKREVNNLKVCHSVMIITNESDDDQGVETERLMRFLKQTDKEVFVYLYTNRKNPSEISQPVGINLLEKIHFNGLFVPKEQQLIQLMNREIDLLIDLSMNEVFPLKYIHAMSKAKLKIGAAMNYKIEYSDITIDISKETTVPYLITQIKHYLTQINQKNGI